MKRILAVVFLAVVIAGVGKGWHVAKGGFSVARIRPFYLEAMRSRLPSEGVKEILRQPYCYLGRGRQCYAFESADGKYVLKLPRFDHFRVPFWMRAMGRGEVLRADKEKRHRFILGSFQIAQEELEEETGLIYVHLGQTEGLEQRVEMFDRIGRRFWLDLDKAAFLVQEKHELMMPQFLCYLRQGEKEKAEQMQREFFALVEARAKKGICNKDPTFLKNFGYDRGRVVQIDVGSFYRGDAEESYRQTVEQFRSWMEAI